METVKKWCYFCRQHAPHTFKEVDGKVVQRCEICLTETKEPEVVSQR